MEIDYKRTEAIFNDIAKGELLNITRDYLRYFSNEQEQIMLDLLQRPKVISVDEPNEKDREVFGVREDGLPNAPSAHGARTKNDGLIHTYPYSKAYENLNVEEEFIKDFSDNIITHELFHYFIRPDLPNEIDPNKDFKSFITEGLVQKYAEMYAQKNGKAIPKSNYGRNVHYAERLVTAMGLSEEDTHRIVFQANYQIMLAIAKKNSGIDLLDEYAQEEKIKKKLIDLIINVVSEKDIQKNKLNEFREYYQKMSTSNDIIADLLLKLDLMFPSENEKQKFLHELQCLVPDLIPIELIQQGSTSELDDAHIQSR